MERSKKGVYQVTENPLETSGRPASIYFTSKFADEVGSEFIADFESPINARLVCKVLNDHKWLQAKCARYEAALKDIASGKVLPQLIAQQALSGEGEKPSDKIAVLCHALAEEVGKDAETARAYLESEGVDMGKLEETARFITWLAELAKLLHEAADGQPIKINQEEARKWFCDGMTPYQCFRETWNME